MDLGERIVVTARYVEEAEEIALYREVLRRLRDRALDVDATREVITRRVEELA